MSLLTSDAVGLAALACFVGGGGLVVERLATTRAVADDARQLAVGAMAGVDHLRHEASKRRSTQQHLCEPCAYCGKPLRAHLT